MRKKTIVNVFHYAVKYLLIALPVVLILISPFVLNEDFKGSSELELTYKYQTNVVNSVDDLVVGNAYHYDISNSSVFYGSIDGSLLVDDLDFSLSMSWLDKTWNGLSSFVGSNVWSDGDDIYYSNSSNQYKLNRDTSTWLPMTWNGFSNLTGQYVWFDGDDIYYSQNANQYKLDRDTSTWLPKTWSGLSSFLGSDVWSDGDDIYYSNSSNQYKLNRDTSTWVYKNWGTAGFNGRYIWSDGDDIYYSTSSSQLELNRALSVWVIKTWNGLSDLTGNYVWSDGNDIYYSINSSQYRLDRDTSTWLPMTWNGYSSFSGANVWTDGNDIYCSTYILGIGSPSFFANSVGNFIYNSHSSDFVDVSFITPLADADNIVVGYQYVDGGLFDDICKFFDRFANLPINKWYVDFLNLIGVGSMVTNTALGLMFYMPLWIAYIFIFDLFLDALLMLPKTAHHWMEKIGGDYE